MTAPPPSSLVAWGRLLRVSLAPSAAADALVGALIGAVGWPSGGAVWLLPLASLAVYHGGLALNDWADREADRRARPDRPLPSGVIAPAAALLVGLALLATGPALAWAVAPPAGVALAGVALLAVAYDLVGRGAWLGPLLLGACRAGNLWAGVLAGAWLAQDDVRPLPEALSLAGPHELAWLAAVAYGVYVFGVSRVGRLEDADRASVGQEPRPWLDFATVTLALAPLAGWLSVPMRLKDDLAVPQAALAIALALYAARPLRAYARREEPWAPAELIPVMGAFLRRLLVFTAVVALASGVVEGCLVAVGALLGYPLASSLRKIFPPS